MKNKTLKQYYDDINNTLLYFEREYQAGILCNEVTISKQTHDNIVVYLRALQLIFEKKMKKRGKK